MAVPDTHLRSRPKEGASGKSGRRALARWLFLALFVAAVGWFTWVYIQIRSYASFDQAQPADAIAVFGAAEYDGRPSPVLRARLDHALTLYQEHLAPLIITLGGAGGPRHTEGGVGRDYLLAHKVPAGSIIAETESRNTEESAHRLSVIAGKNRLNRIIAVSDGTHLFRIHALCTSLGMIVYTSPRPVIGDLTDEERFERMSHEILSYTLWRLHLH